MKEDQIVLDVKDTPKPVTWLALSFQHLFAMFGATILVPFLVELDPAVALISSGLGTIAFLLITKGQVPAYLGSSFAFITPIIVAKASAGIGAAMVGSFLAGLVYGIIALLIKGTGHKWIMKILPPVVVGPVIIVIGLGLAGTAVGMATNDPAGEYSLKYFSAALVTLLITILCSIFLKGFFNLIPVLIGIVGGYIYSLAIGIIDYTSVIEAKWFQVPNFVLPFVDYTPSITLDIVLLMVPVVVVTISEHIGHQLVLGKVVGRDYIEKPGLHRSLLGDGVATMIASLIGGPPNTTYGENIGVLAITRVYSIFVIAGAAVLAIIFGFIGKISALISSIPSPVMGGVSILLFGIIASSGLRMMIDSKLDLGNKRNLIIASVILVIGIGEATLKIGNLDLHGMALAALIGIVLNLVLPVDKDETINKETA
ncbi:solute carrier family 23 protein [Metabacillus halosaccharovorans]|uniref:NCS2 family nucleobase:cation symporter n=1 Tax=Metabacillus halosaccharovorans TaxID=930124 RepID=A0ABT3DKJ4_9BACI|nr:solute carrier family 23 protein [Metabacillus halosaccharovorans]MCV9887583.1 NCS2 family nucleobase:cation symporter [Metabacillus halosaccharovorans]